MHLFVNRTDVGDTLLSKIPSGTRVHDLRHRPTTEYDVPMNGPMYIGEITGSSVTIPIHHEQIDFVDLDAWLIIDSEYQPLRVRRIHDPEVWAASCDACSAPALYKVHVANEDQPTLWSGSCQLCLDASRLDPTSPDSWFKPAER